MTARKRRLKNHARPSDAAWHSYADPRELAKLVQQWDTLPDSLFLELVKQIKESPRIGATKTLLEKLAQIKQRHGKGVLIGSLREAIGESTTRRNLSKQKEARANLIRKTVKNLRSAADNLDRLAALDKAGATTTLLVSGPESAKPLDAAAQSKANLAERLRDHARGLEGELAALRSLSLRWLGVSAKDPIPEAMPKRKRKERALPGERGNLEWLVLVQKIHGFSFRELAHLIEAAHLAWNQCERDVDPNSLKMAFGRFRKRNPNFFDS